MDRDRHDDWQLRGSHARCVSERARNREREREAVREVCVVQRQQANDDDGALELACRERRVDREYARYHITR